MYIANAENKLIVILQPPFECALLAPYTTTAYSPRMLPVLRSCRVSNTSAFFPLSNPIPLPIQLCRKKSKVLFPRCHLLRSDFLFAVATRQKAINRNNVFLPPMAGNSMSARPFVTCIQLCLASLLSISHILMFLCLITKSSFSCCNVHIFHSCHSLCKPRRF
jgi:hypothetical protein